jgi:uncharacterized membrane protein
METEFSSELVEKAKSTVHWYEIFHGVKSECRICHVKYPYIWLAIVNSPIGTRVEPDEAIKLLNGEYLVK